MFFKTFNKGFYFPTPALHFKTSGGGGGGPTLVQSARLENGATSSTTVVGTFGTAVTTGNCVLIAGGTPGTSPTLTFIDNAVGNTYTNVNELDVSGFTLAQAIGSSIINGPTTITMVNPGSQAFMGIVIEEWSGLLSAPYDLSTMQTQATPGNTTDAISSGPITTTTNGELIWGVCVNTDTATSPAVGTGFTQGTASVSGVYKTEHLIQTTAGSISATYTDATDGSTSHFITGVMGLKHA